jgi:hypothetical protein
VGHCRVASCPHHECCMSVVQEEDGGVIKRMIMHLCTDDSSKGHDSNLVVLTLGIYIHLGSSYN